MSEKEEYLSNLYAYINKVDNDVTMILQNLQWDRKHLLEGEPFSACSYDASHMIPAVRKESHEKECRLKKLGYHSQERLLPDPPDPALATLVSFTTADVNQIIKEAASVDPQFKRGTGNHIGAQPLSLARLQRTFTADERRALHDAVVRAAPTHQIPDLPLLSNAEVEAGGSGALAAAAAGAASSGRLALLAQQRDLRRRRAKYRTAAKTQNYSDVLRDVIKTQMEMHSEAQELADNNTAPKDAPNDIPQRDDANHSQEQHANKRVTQRYDKDRSKSANEFRNNKYEDKHYNRQRRDDLPFKDSKRKRDKYSRYHDRNNRHEENRIQIKEEYPRENYKEKQRYEDEKYKERKRRDEYDYRKERRNKEEESSRRHKRDVGYEHSDYNRHKRRRDHRESTSRRFDDVIIKKEKEENT